MTKAYEIMLSPLRIKNCMIKMYKLKYTYNVSNNHDKKVAEKSATTNALVRESMLTSIICI